VRRYRRTAASTWPGFEVPKVITVLDKLPMTATGGPWLRLLAGSVLVVAGAYQFTRWKSNCLRACRTPLSFVMTHDFRSGSRGALLAGAVQTGQAMAVHNPAALAGVVAYRVHPVCQ